MQDHPSHHTPPKPSLQPIKANEPGNGRRRTPGAGANQLNRHVALEAVYTCSSDVPGLRVDASRRR